MHFYFEIPDCIPTKQWNVFVGSALRVSGGNPVDGLPPARHTETVGKLAKLGPALFGEPMQKIVELSMF